MTDYSDERISGDGIVLRPLRDDDIDAVAAACDDEQTQRFLHQLPTPYTREDAVQWVRSTVPERRSRGHFDYAIADPATDDYLGTISMNRSGSSGNEVTVGYIVAPWARGKGVATAALRTTVRIAFGHGAGRLELTTDQANEASQRVAIAAGFEHEGLRRGAGVSRTGIWRDVAVWSRLVTDPIGLASRALPDLPAGGLTDDVVTLRRLQPADVDALHAISLLPEVIATTVRDAPPTFGESVNRCERAGYFWLIGRRADIAICDAATGTFAGHIGLFMEVATGQALIGYDIAREWRQRGFASRATRLLADWAFDVAGLPRLVAGAAPDNVASQRTLERAGMRREGYERALLPGIGGGPRIDNVAYAMLPSDRA